MPIYEYSCKACANRFDLLVRKKTTPACPSCESQDLERLMSIPSVKSATTKAKALKAAKKRDVAQGKERMHAQMQYEQSHDRHG